MDVIGHIRDGCGPCQIGGRSIGAPGQAPERDEDRGTADDEKEDDRKQLQLHLTSTQGGAPFAAPDERTFDRSGENAMRADPPVSVRRPTQRSSALARQIGVP